MKAIVLFVLFLLTCNLLKKPEDKNKNLAQNLGAILVLSNTQAKAKANSGFTIRIPDGVPLTSRITYLETNKEIKSFLQTLGIVQKANAAENDWAFVRQSALWANNNTDTIEAILTPIKNYNLLNNSNPIETTVQIPSGGVFKVKLTVNANSSITTSAYDGSKTFKHKFEMWRASDNRKALEMFFDSADSLSANTNGIVLKYNLNVINPSAFPDDLVCETYSAIEKVSYQGQITDSQKQTISWSGTPSVFYYGSLGGRIVLELMDNKTVLCFKSVVRFQHGSVFSQCGTTGDEYYYSLAYSQFFDSNENKATAKMSLAKNNIDNTNAQVCGYFSRNYGLFKNSGFVQDTVPANNVPNNYPQPSRVDTLFSKIGTPGVGVWDDLSKTKIAGLNIQFSFP